MEDDKKKIKKSRLKRKRDGAKISRVGVEKRGGVAKHSVKSLYGGPATPTGGGKPIKRKTLEVKEVDRPLKGKMIRLSPTQKAEQAVNDKAYSKYEKTKAIIGGRTDKKAVKKVLKQAGVKNIRKEIRQGNLVKGVKVDKRGFGGVKSGKRATKPMPKRKKY